MKTYWRSQWPNIMFGLINIGISLWNFCSEDYLWGVAWFMSACIWLVMSRVEYNQERIELLKAKAEKYDALVQKVEALEELMRTQDKLTDQRLKNLEGKNESSRTLHS